MSFTISIKPVNHPLLSCLALSAGFGIDHTSASGGGGSGGGGGNGRPSSLSFVVMLRSSLPLDLPVEGIQASFSAP